jgi:hypothetical protein
LRSAYLLDCRKFCGHLIMILLMPASSIRFSDVKGMTRRRCGPRLIA